MTDTPTPAPAATEPTSSAPEPQIMRTMQVRLINGDTVDVKTMSDFSLFITLALRDRFISADGLYINMRNVCSIRQVSQGPLGGEHQTVVQFKSPLTGS